MASPVLPVVATPIEHAGPPELLPQQVPLPLKDAACDIRMVNGLAKYECTYTFVNAESTSMECTFFFPKQPKAAVAGLVATIIDADGTSRIIRGVVQEKAEAKATYDGANIRHPRLSSEPT